MSYDLIDIASLRKKLPEDLPDTKPSRIAALRLEERKLRWQVHSECDFDIVLAMLELAHIADLSTEQPTLVPLPVLGGYDFGLRYTSAGGWELLGDPAAYELHARESNERYADPDLSGWVVPFLADSLGIAREDAVAFTDRLPVFRHRHVSNLPRLLSRLPKHSVVAMLAFGRPLADRLGVAEEDMAHYASLLSGWIEGRTFDLANWPHYNDHAETIRRKRLELGDDKALVPDVRGWEPLPDIVTMLASHSDTLFLAHALALGCDPDGEKDGYDKGGTPLSIAVTLGCLPVMEMLCDAGASVTLPDVPLGDELLQRLGYVNFNDDLPRLYDADAVMDFLEARGADFKVTYYDRSPLDTLASLYGTDVADKPWLADAMAKAERIERRIRPVPPIPPQALAA